MRIRFFSRSSLLLVPFLGLLAGCGQDEPAPTGGEPPQASAEHAAGHDPHDVPLTEEEIDQLKQETAQYEEAIEQIDQLQQTVQQETTSGEPAHAHRALDKLTVVLDRLPEAARNSGIPKERWQEVNETAQRLRELFDQVHANIDAGQDPNYAAVAEEIDRGVETLRAIEPEQSE